MNLTVDSQWPIVFADYDGADKTSFMWWTMKHLSSVRVHIAAQLHVYKALARHTKEINAVTEFFGGCGFGTAMVQGIFQPAGHDVIDLDVNCVNHLQRQGFFGEVNVNQGDAKDAMLLPLHADLLVCDFFSFTPVRIPEWKPQLDNLFASNPKAVQITDTSLARTHLHRGRYGIALGETFQTRDEYFNAWNHWAQREYGYNLLAAGYREFAAMMFVQEEVSHPQVKHLTSVDGNEAVQS